MIGTTRVQPVGASDSDEVSFWSSQPVYGPLAFGSGQASKFAIATPSKEIVKQRRLVDGAMRIRQGIS